MGSGAGDIYAGAHGASDATGAPAAGEQASRTDSHDTVAKPVDGNSVVKTASIDDSLAALTERFELHETGLLCDRGTGNRGWNRQYVCADPLAAAREMFELLVGDAAVKPLDNGKGLRMTLDDGTNIVFREITSTPDSPAIDIKNSPSSKIRDQKIHFVKGEQ